MRIVHWWVGNHLYDLCGSHQWLPHKLDDKIDVLAGRSQRWSVHGKQDPKVDNMHQTPPYSAWMKVCHAKKGALIAGSGWPITCKKCIWIWETHLHNTRIDIILYQTCITYLIDILMDDVVNMFQKMHQVVHIAIEKQMPLSGIRSVMNCSVVKWWSSQELDSNIQ